MSNNSNTDAILKIVALFNLSKKYTNKTIGALLVPLHHKLDKWMTHLMEVKNKKMRLEAANKTIAKRRWKVIQQ